MSIVSETSKSMRNWKGRRAGPRLQYPVQTLVGGSWDIVRLDTTTSIGGRTKSMVTVLFLP